jgi:hypothetical protein
MTTPLRLAAPGILAVLLAGCGPAIDTVRLAPVPYPPRPHDFRIRMYSTERPRCPYEELATIRARKRNWFVSMEDVTEAVRHVTRELGGDAVIGVTGGTQISGGGTIIDGTGSVSVDSEPYITGTIVRFRQDDCRD